MLKFEFCDDKDLDLEVLFTKKSRLTSGAVRALYSRYLDRQRQRATWDFESVETGRLVADYVEEKQIEEALKTWRSDDRKFKKEKRTT